MSIKHDSYCWKCCELGTNLKCINCVRSSHADCESEVDGNLVNPEEWLCLVCVTLKASEDIDKVKELQMMPFLMKRMRSGKMFKALNDSMEITANSEYSLAHSIVNPITLDDIIENSKNYTSFNQLYFDICWIVHNYTILYTDGNERTKQAKSLLDYIANEIDGIRKCAECYINKIKRPKIWFKLLCTEPHLIVWAKDENDSYWPAKVFAVDGQQVNIQFFGHHKSGSVSAANCSLYFKSIERPPNASIWYNMAMKEAIAYIDKICQKYGSFEYVEKETTFDPSLLQKYVRQMMPLALNGIQESFDIFDDPINSDSDNDNERDAEGEGEGLLEQPPILVDSTQSNGDKSPSESVTEEVFHTHKRPFILLERINLNLALGDASEPPKKKVRFSDEHGNDLAEVRLFDTIDKECEQNHDDDPKESDEDSTMDNDAPTESTGENSSTNNPHDPYSSMETIQKCMEKMQVEIKNFAILTSELKNLKKAYATCQLKSNELLGELNAVKYERDQAVLEAKESSAHNEAQAKTISELTQQSNVHKQMMDSLKAQLQAKEAEIVSMKEKQARQQSDLLHSIGNIFEK